MEKISIPIYKIFRLLVLSFVLLTGFLYTNLAKAETTCSKLSGQQLAYFVGYHSGNYYEPSPYYEPPPYHHHRHHRRFYWTDWRYIGHGCSQSCLIDRWNGGVIRCKRSCR
ncbi:hypothetical protein [Fluoribacter gormanii]|uniref:hypothetical protein n=1 Tax=Fluoribacter gormanii TaxID=464 RepID=UPI00104162F6|nr:hypothetical protein [Fluoribacter gormanii]